MAILNSYVSLPEGKVLQLTTTNVFGYLWMWIHHLCAMMAETRCGVSHVTDGHRSPEFAKVFSKPMAAKHHSRWLGSRTGGASYFWMGQNPGTFCSPQVIAGIYGCE